ncbi:MAG: hypothetical protein RMX98_011395 [Nostoc sp. DedQUE02]|nr:hypothetical protein [Nostoc sp. DedQUE02]
MQEQSAKQTPLFALFEQALMLLCVGLTHPRAQLSQMPPTVNLLVFCSPSDTHPKWMQCA